MSDHPAPFDLHKRVPGEGAAAGSIIGAIERQIDRLIWRRIRYVATTNCWFASRNDIGDAEQRTTGAQPRYREGNAGQRRRAWRLGRKPRPAVIVTFEHPAYS